MPQHVRARVQQLLSIETKAKTKHLSAQSESFQQGVRKALVCWRVRLCCTYCCKQCMPQTSYATATLSLSRTHIHKHTNCMRRITVSMPHCIAIFVATSNNRYICNAVCYQLCGHKHVGMAALTVPTPATLVNVA